MSDNINNYSSEKKLDLILERLDVIEEALGINTSSRKKSATAVEKKEDLIKKACELRKLGYPIREISQRMNVSIGTVSKYLETLTEEEKIKCNALAVIRDKLHSAVDDWFESDDAFGYDFLETYIDDNYEDLVGKYSAILSKEDINIWVNSFCDSRGIRMYWSEVQRNNFSGNIEKLFEF